MRQPRKGACEVTLEVMQREVDRDRRRSRQQINVEVQCCNDAKDTVIVTVISKCCTHTTQYTMKTTIYTDCVSSRRLFVVCCTVSNSTYSLACRQDLVVIGKSGKSKVIKFLK